MYPVSAAFLETIRQPVIDYYVDGTIGSVEFDESNIVTGSFHIQNQCTDTSDVVLGSVYTGTLTATFYGLNIPRYSWVGKVITPDFYLHVGNSWQHVPLGVYTIKEAKHSAEGVEITAYDNMIKLDKKFKAGKFKTAQKMYQHLQTICTACGLTLGMTEEEIQALPNGNTNLGIVGTKSNKYLSYKKYSNDIDTYRDLVFWIAQSMGTFATINRDGELVFRKYKKTTQTVDEITESYRLAGAVFDDFTTNYTGIYVTNTKDGEEIYYGYDVDELTTAIADTEAAIAENEGERMELWTQYQQGEITEQEYKAAVKPLEKRWKNLEKQLEWLNQALVKAQNEEDGLFMDLGENPILQPDGIGSTYAAMRKRVLKALDAISYTPFTCSTVVGVHYDLGDIIQFTGGHATEIGETCCMMAYDFNLNGEFQMQGFGSDPSKPVIKNKNSKKADKADKNGVSAPNVSTGANLPETWNDGDLFIKTGETSYDALDDTNIGKTASASHPISIENFDNDNNTFSFDIKGFPDGYGYGERIWFNLEDLTVGKTYAIEFDAQYTTSAGFLPSWSDRLTICGTTIPFNKDTEPHHYSGTFTMRSGGIADFNYQSSYDDATFIQEFTNFRIKEQTNNDSISVYDDGWKNIDFVRRISGTSSSGKKIGTAENSDDTTTDIYVPNMSGASASAAGSNGLVPAPASGDQGKFLRGDGTWQNAGGTDGYAPTDATEATLADDDKMPFYDTSASGKRNSTWANIKAKLKAYFDTIYGSVTGVKGDSESTYRTGNVNITSDNIGALSKNGGTISGNILPDNNYSYALGNYGHAFGAVSAASFYVDDSVNGGRSKVYFEGTSPLNSVKIPEGNGTMATEAYVAKLRVEKTWAEYQALTNDQKNDPEIVYYITDLEAVDYPVQDDGTATDLTDGSVPTGRTVESWVNSLLKPSTWSLSSNGCVMIKTGRIVTCHFRGLGGLNNYSATGGAELINSAHAEYRPYLSVLGMGLIWNSDSANYVCTIEISTAGVMTVKYKDAINTRAGSIGTSYALYGSMSWITN